MKLMILVQIALNHIYAAILCIYKFIEKACHFTKIFKVIHTLLTIVTTNSYDVKYQYEKVYTTNTEFS